MRSISRYAMQEPLKGHQTDLLSPFRKTRTKIAAGCHISCHTLHELASPQEESIPSTWFQ